MIWALREQSLTLERTNVKNKVQMMGIERGRGLILRFRFLNTSLKMVGWPSLTFSRVRIMRNGEHWCRELEYESKLNHFTLGSPGIMNLSDPRLPSPN